MILGEHSVPLTVEHGDLILSITKERGMLVYSRTLGADTASKLIAGEPRTILIHPVEPVNLPKPLTSNYLLDFERPLVVAPGVSRVVFMKFPIELAVFYSESKIPHKIDVFSFEKPRFSLYGELRTGLLCRYWKSEVITILPKIESLKQGIMELAISNSSSEFAEVTKAVFSAFGMKLYFSERMVAVRAKMDIVSTTAATTDFIDSPLRSELKKATELYTGKKFPLATSRFEMREGL